MSNTFYFVNSEAMDIRDENGDWLPYPTDEQYMDALTKDDELTLFTDYDVAVEVARQGLAEDEAYAFPIYTFTSELKGRPVKFDGTPARRLNRDDLTLVSASLEHVDESYGEIPLNDSPENSASEESSQSEENSASSSDESSKKSASSSSSSSSSASEEEVVASPTSNKAAAGKKAKAKVESESSSSEEEKVDEPAPVVAPVAANSIWRNGLAWTGNTLLWLGTGVASGTVATLKMGKDMVASGVSRLRPLARPSVAAGVTTVGGKLVADALNQTPAMIGQLGAALTNSNSTVVPTLVSSAAATVDAAVDSVPYVREVKPLVYLGLGALAGAEAVHQGINYYNRRKNTAPKAAETVDASAKATTPKPTATRKTVRK